MIRTHSLTLGALTLLAAQACGGQIGDELGPVSGGSAATSSTGTSATASGGIGSATAAGGTGGATEPESAACATVSANHGMCDALIGWAFTGTQCGPLGGCTCEPDCNSIYLTAKECAQACHAKGYCNNSAFVGKGLIGVVKLGTTCDSIVACVPGALFNQTEFPFDTTACQTDTVCGTRAACPIASTSTTIDQVLWDQLCVASIIPNVEIQCTAVLL